jgi:glycosyltransferase involved in cell wall biosynthesis
MTSKTKRRVLLLSFIFSPNVGGVETHLDELCEYLVRKEFKVTVITYKPIVGNAKVNFLEKKQNLTIYRIPWIRGNLFNKLLTLPILQMLYVIPGIFIFSLIYLIFHRKKIDIIQAHGFNMALVASVLSLISRIPYTVNTHVSFSFRKKTFYTFILGLVLKRAKKILILTDNLVEELEKIGIDKNKIIIYHYWVDKSFFPISKKKARAILGLKEKSFLVLFVGRFIKEKGVLNVIKALKNSPTNIRLVMIGAGPLEAEMKKIKGNSSSISIYDSISRRELPKWYSAADITIIPSFNATDMYAEGIPRVLIESLSCGTPVVATKAGGLKEILTSDIGYYIEPNVKSIKLMIESLSKKQHELGAMRRKTISYAQRVFDTNTNAALVASSLTI